MEDFYQDNENDPGELAASKKKWRQRPGCLFLIILGIIIFVFLIIFGVKIFVLVRKINRGEIDIPEKFTRSMSLAINSENLKNSSQKLNMDTDDDPALGPKGAFVTIVEFSDFECPFCRQAHPIIREMVNIYGNKIRYVYRDFPVSDVHTYAQKAAEGGECADEQNKFWAYQDKLFLNQENLNVNDLKLYALQIGLNPQLFNACLDSGKYENEVKQDFYDGAFAGVRGTPTWFIEGVKVEGVISAEMFKKIIDEQIAIKSKLLKK